MSTLPGSIGRPRSTRSVMLLKVLEELARPVTAIVIARKLKCSTQAVQIVLANARFRGDIERFKSTETNTFKYFLSSHGHRSAFTGFEGKINMIHKFYKITTPRCGEIYC